MHEPKEDWSSQPDPDRDFIELMLPGIISGFPTETLTRSDVLAEVRKQFPAAQFMVCDYCGWVTIEHRVVIVMQCPNCGRKAINLEFAS